jgi:hypothetical protein
MWHKKFHRTLVVFDLLLVVIATLWFIRDLDYEPLTVLLVSLSGLATLFHTNPTKRRKKVQESGTIQNKNLL